MRERVDRALHEAFRPEFLNRVDDTIIFSSLSRDDLVQIVDLQLEKLNLTLADRRITVEATPAARQRLAEVGYDPAFGARPLKRAIQRLVQDPLALRLLEGKLAPGDGVLLDDDGQGITLGRAAAVAE